MSAFNENSKIWFSGRWVDWKDANIHVMSHVVHYGSSVFEGIRCYKTPKGTAIYRLREHIRRLFNSAKIYRMHVPFTEEQVIQACIDIIRVNELEEAYIRPVIFRGYDSLGVDPKNCPIEVIVGTWH